MNKINKEKRHYNIPIFIPQQACPHQCIYCNQNFISGQQKAPSISDVKQTIQTCLSTIKEESYVQVAFFGGTFTGLPLERQISYLQVIKHYIEEGKIQSVRLSTRPDYINSQILDLLQQYNVTDIELGAQSLDNEVLQYSERGHSSTDIIKASQLIKSYGFKLGLQMMIGLPKDSLEKSIYTANKIVELRADTTRIYPTLVIDRTPLAILFKQGKYIPLSIEDAIIWTKEIYKIFIDNNIKILRIGLHPSKDLINGKGYLAGPFHISFFELVLTAIWKDRFNNLSSDVTTIIVNPADINYAIGYQSSNIKYLKSKNNKIHFLQDEKIDRNQFIAV